MVQVEYQNLRLWRHNDSALYDTIGPRLGARAGQACGRVLAGVGGAVRQLCFSVAKIRVGAVVECKS